MIRAIFNLFRHGSAEASFRRDPFILIKTFAPTLIEGEDQKLTSHNQPMRVRWGLFPTDGAGPALQMRWAAESDRALQRS